MRVGILGGGQLGRMLALAGYPLGLRFRCFDASLDAPTGPLSELHVGSYSDQAALAHFIDGLDLVTYEFENVPVAAARWLAEHLPVYPPPEALAVAQERLEEKQFFTRLGIPTPRYLPINAAAELEPALQAMGFPCMLKTRRLGYDGKGQLQLHQAADAHGAWERLGQVPLILEAWVPFDREVSLVAVKSRTGAAAFYPLVENHHRAGILLRSLAPMAGWTSALQRQAEGLAQRVFDALNYVGVLAIEFFQVGEQLLANEMAPRVHNSGHWTIEGATASQFANHWRALLGWPLGSTAPLGCIGMLNLIGHLPDPASLLALPYLYYHQYGKLPYPGRKVGHLTVVAPNESIRDEIMAQAAQMLGD